MYWKRRHVERREHFILSLGIHVYVSQFQRSCTDKWKRNHFIPIGSFCSPRLCCSLTSFDCNIHQRTSSTQRKPILCVDSPKVCVCSLRGHLCVSLLTTVLAFGIQSHKLNQSAGVQGTACWMGYPNVRWGKLMRSFLRYLGVLNANDKTLELLDLDNSDSAHLGS